MTVNKSIIEDVELANGQTMYVQYAYNGTQVILSFDGPDINISVRVESTEVDKIIKALMKAQGEANAD